MIFRQLFDRESCTYTYVLADEKTREAVIIDPVYEMASRDSQLIKELNLKLLYSLETHIHADHITGAALLKKNFQCKTVLGKTQGVNCADLQIEEGEKIYFGRYFLTAIFTPGHTDNSYS